MTQEYMEILGFYIRQEIIVSSTCQLLLQQGNVHSQIHEDSQQFKL